VQPRTLAYAARPAAVPSVLHIDGGHGWAGGQNQVRLLVRELQVMGLKQLCICPAGSPLEQRLQLEGLPVRGIRWRGASDPRAVIAIARAMREFHVAHCHDAHALQAAIIPGKVLATPIVATRRVSFDTNAFKWNRASRVIAISEAVRDKLLRSGVSADRIRLVYSGIDVQEVRSLAPARPTLRERAGIDTHAFVAGNIGSLVGYKNQIIITESARDTDGVRWILIGEGRERASIENAIQARGVSNLVVLAGEITDARRTLREMDLFVFTSIGEALGTSVLDAMAAGVPVIAADSAGPAEVLRPVHDETGCTLYNPRDARSLATLVQRAHDNADARHAMIVAQNRRIEDFRSERTAMLTLDVYREVLR
jgi:glycosyltransferase involved in cell wall biosynthesis